MWTCVHGIICQSKSAIKKKKKRKKYLSKGSQWAAPASIIIPLMPTCKHGNATPGNVDLCPLLLRHLTALLTQRSPPPATSLPEFPAAKDSVGAIPTLSANCHEKR